MKYKKVENKEEDDSEVLDIELIEHGEMSKESDIQDNSELFVQR